MAEIAYLVAESFNPYADSGAPLRLSGTLRERPDPEGKAGAYYFATDHSIVFESTGKAWIVRKTLGKDDVAGRASGLAADMPPPGKMVGWIYHTTDTMRDYEAFPSGWYTTPLVNPFTAPDIAPDSLAKLHSSLSNQFGCSFRSAGGNANPEMDYILVQTIGASPTNPYKVSMEQFILEAFDGEGQFDLVEREARRMATDGVADGDLITSETFDWQEADESKRVKVKVDGGTPKWFTILDVPDSGTIQVDRDVDLGADGDLILVMNGEDEETLATKDGFESGELTGTENSPGAWSRLSKVITSDKLYKVVFVPGDTAGHGAFSMNITKLGK